MFIPNIRYGKTCSSIAIFRALISDRLLKCRMLRKVLNKDLIELFRQHGSLDDLPMKSCSKVVLCGSLVLVHSKYAKQKL